MERMQKVVATLEKMVEDHEVRAPDYRCAREASHCG